MKLSAPIFKLKRQAKLLSRSAGIPLSAALDRIAKGQGFPRWSLLSRHEASKSPAIQIMERLHPGDMLLLAARPEQGKTLLGLDLIVKAIVAGRTGAFFTLEYTTTDVLRQFRAIGADPNAFGDACALFTSDSICAGYVTDHLQTAQQGTLVVIDYLQLLDQQRQNPDLAAQIATLKSFAETKGVIIVILSQIDRSFDPSAKEMPDVGDIRLPNPLDLSLFSQTCFLNDGNIKFAAQA